MNKHLLKPYILLLCLFFAFSLELIAQESSESIKKLESKKYWSEAKLDYYLNDGFLDDKQDGELILDGINFMRSQNPRAAIVKFKHWLKSNPDEMNVFILIGMSYALEESYDSAMVYYEKAHRLDPENSILGCELASLMFLQGDTLGALNEIESAYIQDSNNLLVICTYAEIKLDVDDLDEASRVMERIEAEDAELFSSWSFMGSLLFDMGYAEGELVLMQPPLALGDGSEYDLYQRGLDYLDKGDEENAINDFLSSGRLENRDQLEANMMILTSLERKFYETVYYMKQAYIKNDNSHDSLFYSFEVLNNEYNDLLFTIAPDELKETYEYPELFSQVIYNILLAEYDSAYLNISAYLSEYPNDILALRLLQLSQYYLDKLDDAAKTVDQLVAMDTNLIYVNLMKAMILEDRGDYQSGLLYSNRVLRKSPDYFSALTYNAWAKYSLRMYEDVVSTINHAITINPYVANVYNTRGLAFSAMGNYNAAKKDFEKALSLDPNFCYSISNLAMVYINMKEYNLASYWFNKSIDQCGDDDPEVFYQRSILYKYQGLRGAAIKDLDKAIALKPNNGLYYCERGINFRLEEEYEKAMDDHKKSIQLHPEYRLPHNEIVMILLAQKKVKEARSQLEKNVKKFPDDTFNHNALGWIYYSEQKMDKSKEWFSKGIEVYPENVYAMAYLGYIELLDGKYSTAHKHYTMANSILKKTGGSNTEYVEMLRYLIKEDYRKEEAKKILRNVFKVSP